VSSDRYCNRICGYGRRRTLAGTSRFSYWPCESRHLAHHVLRRLTSPQAPTRTGAEHSINAHGAVRLYKRTPNSKSDDRTKSRGIARLERPAKTLLCLAIPANLPIRPLVLLSGRSRLDS
jgi:hypothetical protein